MFFALHSVLGGPTALSMRRGVNTQWRAPMRATRHTLRVYTQMSTHAQTVRAEATLRLQRYPRLARCAAPCRVFPCFPIFCHQPRPYEDA